MLLAGCCCDTVVGANVGCCCGLDVVGLCDVDRGCCWAQLLAPMQVAVVAPMLFVALVMWKWMVVG